MGPSASGAGGKSAAEGGLEEGLEDVGGERALAWVREQNAASTRELEGAAAFAKLRQRLLSIYESSERIPGVTKHGAY